MADPGEWNQWTALLATLGGIAVGLVGAAAGCWNWLRAAARAVRLSDAWHDRYGDRPVDAIAELHRVAQRCTSIGEVQRELFSERLGLGCYVCNSDGECVWSNAVLRSMLELDSSEILGFGWLGPVVEKAEAHAEWIRSVGKHLPYNATYTVRRSDGDRRAQTRAFACVTKSGELLAFVGYVEFIEE